MSNELTISEAQKITGDFKAAVIKLEHIQKNQNLLFETFQEIVHEDNKFFMDKAFVYRALDEKETQVVKKIKQFDELNARLENIEKNAFQELEDSILSIKNNDFFEPLKLQIKQEQLNFEKELKESKQIITEKLAFLHLEVIEFNANITEQIKSIELSKDIITKEYKNYLKNVEKQAQELLNNFQKIEVNKNKNLEIFLFITAGISITTLIVCGITLFKLLKFFH
ncbi:hypothetical protein [Aliarcobacter butzleri]|uniref:hypothetical protein n=1 Tax=Aliarcobacter butzleri TaxID=28197 RepID=UPI00263DF560|nr:hypothetical protein [Aliarcobacter butzleri]MDN5059301.1 hypothetical protein [Aliarcobacter butzleri]